MAKNTKHREDREMYGKCMICLGNIPVEYYFAKGDEIICYECGTEYTLLSKNPVKLEMSGELYDLDDFDGEFRFDDY